MVDFFKNISQWIVENKDKIILFFTSGSFVTLITSIVLTVKQIKKSIEIKNTNSRLEQSLNSVIDNTNGVTDINTIILSNSRELIKLKKELSTLESSVTSSMNILVSKINAIVDVQSVVYSTINDDTVKQQVQSILLNAKYTEANIRSKLEKEIEELKLKVESVANDAKDVVVSDENIESDTVVEKTKKSSKKNLTQRY